MPEKKLYRIRGMRGHNVARLTAFDLQFDADEHLIPVRGQNGAGKTTLLNIVKTLEGGRAVPKDAVTHGQESGEFELDLTPIDGNGDDIEIRRRLKPDGKGSLRVLHGNLKGSQTTLDSLLGKLRDPLEFLSLHPTKQRDLVLGMVDLGGFDLAENSARIEKVVEDRRDAGRDVRRLQGACDSLAERVGDYDPDTAQGSAALMEEFEAAQAAHSEQRQLDGRVEQIAARVREDESELAYVEEEIRRLQDRAESLRSSAEDAKAEGRKAREAAEAHRETLPDLDAIRARLDVAREADAKAGLWRELQERRQELEAREAEHGALEQELADLRRQRTDALAKAVFPAEGMGYDPEADVLTLHGSRWDQASDGEKLIASVDMAIAQPSDVRVFWLKNGSLLDAEHLAALEERLREANYYAFVELVGDDGDGVLVKDGEAKRVRGGEA